MGIICPLGEHSFDIIYSEHRILHPLRRKGDKGSYDFEPISWDDAYGIIVDKLNRIKREYGPEAAAIYTGVGSFELSLCDVFQPAGVAVSSASSVLFPYGSPNTMGVGALCYVAYGMIAPHVTCGRMLINMFNDIENSRMVIVWGTNPATDSPPIEMNRVLAAKKRGARIYCEIVGYGNTADANHVTAPSPEGEGAARCMKMALRHASLNPEAISYINAHGTSTPQGDIAETEAIKTVFADHARKLAVSSTKGATGHMLGAAGAVEMVICTKAIQTDTVPPTINYEVPDPECDLDYVPNTARPATVDVAMSNSFGFGGHNVSVLVKRFAA